MIWFDFTASYHWRRAPTGITRVEQECARWLLQAGADHVRFCIYDIHANVWREMPHEQAQGVLNRRYDGHGQPLADMPQWQPSTTLQFASNDTYVCLNADQTAERLLALYRARQRGVRIIGIAYDIIQILYPHFYWPQADQGCARYFVDLAWCAEHLFCISRRTRDDLLGFYRRVGAPEPSMSLVRLGDTLPGVCAPVSSDVAELLNTPFILVVGTIEIRKNHELLYRAVLDLLARGCELPVLVFAGMRGWRVDDLLQTLEHDPRVRDRIRILSHASDADIDALYKACLFTAFPSHYEGWGLPVAESLAYGKFCIASNAGAIPEVGGELTALLSPYDVRAWADALWYYAQNHDERQRREVAIRHNYRPTSWNSAAASMMQSLLTNQRVAQE